MVSSLEAWLGFGRGWEMGVKRGGQSWKNLSPEWPTRAPSGAHLGWLCSAAQGRGGTKASLHQRLIVYIVQLQAGKLGRDRGLKRQPGHQRRRSVLLRPGCVSTAPITAGLILRPVLVMKRGSIYLAPALAGAAGPLVMVGVACVGASVSLMGATLVTGRVIGWRTVVCAAAGDAAPAP